MRKCVDAHPPLSLPQGGGESTLESATTKDSCLGGGDGSRQDTGREEVRVCWVTLGIHSFLLLPVVYRYCYR